MNQASKKNCGLIETKLERDQLTMDGWLCSVAYDALGRGLGSDIVF